MWIDAKSLPYAHNLVNVLDLTPSQRSMAHALLNLTQSRITREETQTSVESLYETKKISFGISPDATFLSLVVETGLKDDEGTAASLFARDRYHWMIFSHGGLRALNKDGEWIKGRKAKYVRTI